MGKTIRSPRSIRELHGFSQIKDETSCEHLRHPTSILRGSNHPVVIAAEGPVGGHSRWAQPTLLAASAHPGHRPHLGIAGTAFGDGLQASFAAAIYPTITDLALEPQGFAGFEPGWGAAAAANAAMVTAAGNPVGGQADGDFKETLRASTSKPGQLSTIRIGSFLGVSSNRNSRNP